MRDRRKWEEVITTYAVHVCIAKLRAIHATINNRATAARTTSVSRLSLLILSSTFISVSSPQKFADACTRQRLQFLSRQNAIEKPFSVEGEIIEREISVTCTWNTLHEKMMGRCELGSLSFHLLPLGSRNNGQAREGGGGRMYDI